ncbi:MAG: cyclic nucleotide-binding domain-containing protein [Chloroflexi bacterium]|nr:cyclic nucleotide-binding domain-containing protein [Chloroflexota bacterium]
MPGKTNLKLRDGARVAVMGGGPAGSFTAYFLLDMAARAGLKLHVDMYEPRDFAIPGPPGCNMCGGVVSESLVQALAAEGIALPPTVVQRGISAYVLHTDAGSTRIATPMEEKRIAAVYRGPGPRGLKEFKWGSFDGHLQSLAKHKGANVIRARVDEIKREPDGLRITSRAGAPQLYDLLVVAAGVNTAAAKLFQGLELDYRPPKATKTFIREYYLGAETINRHMGTSLHVFLLNLPHLEFAMIVPKGDYVTVCLLGEDIDDAVMRQFMENPAVRECLPDSVSIEQGACQCAPRMNVQSAVAPFADRIVFVGDCGVTRLYKDGIGAAYRAAKAAATTAIFQGISADDFRRHYAPFCRSVDWDNAIGRIIFLFTRLIQKLNFAHYAVLRMVVHEQKKEGGTRWMSTVLWDTFTGSAPYREIFVRTLHPAFWLRFAWDLALSLVGIRARVQATDQSAHEAIMDSSKLGKTYQPGEVLLRQGETTEGMLVILDGQVAIMREADGHEVFLGVRGAGEFLGGTAMLEQQVQTATVRALSQVRVITVDKENFTRRIHEDPSLAFRLFQLMSRRLREASQETALLKQELDRLTDSSIVG